MTAVISLEALRLAKQALVLNADVILATGIRAGGATQWSYASDMVVVGLTRRTIILASRWVPDRTTSFDLVSGVSKPRNGVEYCIHPAHLRLLQGLLGVDAAGEAVAA